MSSLLAETIDLLCREKNIDSTVVINAVVDAVTIAARKHFKTKEDFQASYNEETQQLELYALKEVAEEIRFPDTQISIEDARAYFGDDVEVEVGDVVQFPRPMEDLGRIAAQTAKQIIFQKVREAERDNVYREYSNRIGEMINGLIKRFERGNIIIDLGKIEALLPRSEQSVAESFNQGDRIRVIISGVIKETKGPQIEVSRIRPEFVERLFETEVPEIYDGTVQIKCVVREPGDRAKIAVISNDPDVDPVGACVGMKGARVQAVIRELRGEKIDIIPWSEDPVVFAANALSPAKVSKVQILDFQQRRLEIVVEDSQLSLAIGKKGQNVRLASKLVGWHIDVNSEGHVKHKIASQIEALLSNTSVPLAAVQEIDSLYSERLAEIGISTAEQLAAADLDDIAHALDISLDETKALIERAEHFIQSNSMQVSRDIEQDLIHSESSLTSDELYKQEPNVDSGEESVLEKTDELDVVEELPQHSSASGDE